MSNRTFDVGALGLGEEATVKILFGMFDFVGDPQFVHTGLGVATWGEEDWWGVGTWATMEPVKDSMSFKSTRVRVGLARIPEITAAAALTEATWGRLAEIYLGTLNATDGALTKNPELIIRGRMGPPEASFGQENFVSVTIEDVRSGLDRINGTRATLLDHQVEAPNDMFYSLLPQMLDFKFVFNGEGIGQDPSAGWGFSSWYDTPPLY